MSRARSAPFYAGLALVTAATLAYEVLLTRLISAVTWYHLAFFAVSLALLGATAAAVWVQLRPRRFTAERAPADLASAALAFALGLPVSHLLLLVLRIPAELGADAMGVAALAMLAIAAAVPFALSGVVVVLALTRVDLPVGRVYGADLIGAAAGCLLAVGAMETMDPSSGVLATAALAAVGAAALAAWAGRRRRGAAALAVLLAAAALLNAAAYPRLLRVDEMKGRRIARPTLVDRWNSHSRVTAGPPREGKAVYWGPGTKAPAPRAAQVPIRIDGGAFTVATRFDGDLARLGWLGYDVTSMPYHLRRPRSVAVIGAGGGRDVLTALAFGAERVEGIEINGVLVDLLREELRGFAGLAGRPDVRLVHADGRAWIARTRERRDVLQMSLVDTSASTAAGALTLTENGLYTIEAWQLFLRRLAPDGLLAVSRWYQPAQPAESARLLALAVAALLAEGVEHPARHVAIATGGDLGTLIASPAPLRGEDLSRLRDAAATQGFRLLAVPGERSSDPLLAAILDARSSEELAAATRHALLELTPPSDARPFFFNMLRPRAWLSPATWREPAGEGALGGNKRAAATLGAILALAGTLTLLAIVLPLLRHGLPQGLALGDFTAGALWFSLIGLGFMTMEIGLMQRFSLLLGQPVLSLVATLMSLILATGLGSLASERLAVERWARRLPAAMATLVALVVPALPALARAAAPAPLPVRFLAVWSLTVPLGLVAGLFFPLGMRLLRTRAPGVDAWMWGLNGAFGVLGTILAVVLSMAYGIPWCLAVAGLLYLLLLLPAARLSPR